MRIFSGLTLFLFVFILPFAFPLHLLATGDGEGNSSATGPTSITAGLCEQIRQQHSQHLGVAIANVPEIGDASKTGVCTYGLNLNMPALVINGYQSNSPLSNWALGSAEVALDSAKNSSKNLNLFEIMLPDTPRFQEDRSRGEAYVAALAQAGLPASIAHFHWWGMSPFMAAIHTQNVGMDPVQFAAKISTALSQVGMMAGGMPQPPTTTTAAGGA